MLKELVGGEERSGVGGGFQNGGQISNFSHFPLKQQSFWARSFPNSSNLYGREVGG